MASPNDVARNDETPVSAPRQRLPAEHLDATPIRKVSLRQWQAIWPRLGHRMPANPTAIDEVVDVLAQPGLSRHCHDLLQVLHELGTPQGAQALHDAAICSGIGRDDWPDAVEDLAAEVWLRAQELPEYERVLLLAELDMHERDGSASSREFVGRGARIPADVLPRLEGFREHMRKWFRGEGMGTALTVKLCVQVSPIGL